jgi:hypothetical protein
MRIACATALAAYEIVATQDNHVVGRPASLDGCDENLSHFEYKIFFGSRGLRSPGILVAACHGFQLPVVQFGDVGSFFRVHLRPSSFVKGHFLDGGCEDTRDSSWAM